MITWPLISARVAGLYVAVKIPPGGQFNADVPLRCYQTAEHTFCASVSHSSRQLSVGGWALIDLVWCWLGKSLTSGQALA
jgi:hypothetical protein